MILFMLKKTMIEYFDRFFLYFAGNSITMGLILLSVSVYIFLGGNVFIPLAGFFIFFSVYMFIWLGANWGKSDNTRSAISLLLLGLIFGLIQVFVFTAIVSAARFYWNMGAFGVVATVLCILVLVLWAGGSVYAPYFLALRDRGYVWAFKYSFQLFYERPAVGILVFFTYLSSIIISISVFLGSSFGIALFSQIARAFLIIDEYETANRGEEADWRIVFRKEIENIEDVNIKKLLMPWTKDKKKSETTSIRK